MIRIIALEGLGSHYIENLLLPRLDLNNVKVEIYRHDVDLATIAANAPGVKLVILGHSLGGVTAVRLAELIGADVVVTMDPRHNNIFLSFIWWALGSLQVTRAKVAINFCHAFTWGLWLPGLKVDGAENRLLRTSHTALPGHQSVVDYVGSVV